MAITQTKNNRDLLGLMDYDMNTHRLIPKNELCKKYGADIGLESQIETYKQAELYNISDTIYDFMLSHMPQANQEIVLALIAENANDEQITMARAFGAMAQFVLRGGDETSHRNGINFTNSMYIEAGVMDKMSLGLNVQRILSNGNGKNNTGLWKPMQLEYEVSDVTDLVFGTDY